MKGCHCDTIGPKEGTVTTDFILMSHSTLLLWKAALSLIISCANYSHERGFLLQTESHSNHEATE